MRICPRCRSTYAEETDFCGIDGERLVEQDTDPLIGERIDRYEFVERLGGGAMGVVYRARHTELDRFFAIKVLYGEIGANKSLVGRFRREAQAVSKITHPNIISVVDFGTTDNGLNFLVMESVEGQTLADILEETPRLSPERAAWITYQVASGLAEAHRLGFVHRDVKPANVMISGAPGRDFVKLLDFGIVGLTDSQFTTKLTGTGRIVGTPRYMSPEQARGSGVGASADLYSLGVMLYEMIAGDVPFPGDVMADVLVMHSTVPPPPLPPARGMDELAMKMLQKRPEDRIESADAVMAEVREVFPDLIALADGPISNPGGQPIAPPFDEDEIPTMRPQPSEPLETPELVTDEPHSAADGLVTPMVGVSASQEVAVDLYESGPDLSSFEQPRPTSDFDPAPLRAPPVSSSNAAIFSTLGSASGHLAVPSSVRQSFWSRHAPLVVTISLILSVTALAIVFMILREDPAEPMEKVFEAEMRAQQAEQKAQQAIQRAVEAERAAQKLVDTASAAASAIQAEKKRSDQDGKPAVSLSERELVFRHTLNERGLTMRDLTHLGATRELADLWMQMRDEETEQSAQVLTALIEKTQETTLTNRLLWKKYERIASDFAKLEKQDPALAKSLLGTKRKLRRALNRRRLSQARRQALAKELTAVELQITSALMKKK